jgi:MFS family permease
VRYQNGFSRDAVTDANTPAPRGFHTPPRLQTATESGRKNKEAASTWSPFKHRAFTVLWVATVVSNIGTWMQNAAAGWLMTGLDPDPFIVALVQVATTLPMFLLGLPAGALADILDRRRLLIAVQAALTLLSMAFAFVVWKGLVSPALLLGFTFLSGAGAALIAPSWQAIVPQLVPREELSPAVALNSVGINISRAVGPALAGIIIGVAGLAAPFWVNAFSNLGVIAALTWWKPAQTDAKRLPAEHFRSAIRTGLRYAAYNPHLRATLLRSAGFFISASAYWALLPLVARNQIQGGPQLYGILLGAIGAGAVGGAFTLPKLKKYLGADKLVAAGTAGTAIALVLFAVARDPTTGFIASVVAGLSWIAVLATLNVSAQMALPSWVRGRGLAVFAIVLFGSMSAGSAIWGQTAGWIGLPAAHLIAAIALLMAVPLLWPWKLQTGAEVDMSPSLHWPAPVVSGNAAADRGPVLVTVEYGVPLQNERAFLEAMTVLKQERHRDGAYRWGLHQDAANPERFVETFELSSWLEHLRQHQRVTEADRQHQESITSLLWPGSKPTVTHLIAPDDYEW